MKTDRKSITSSNDIQWWTFSLVGILGALTFGLYDYLHDFSRFWDFNVYLKAQTHLFETGTPYFERESLRYIYPPSANFLLYVVSDIYLYKTLYFILTGTLWTLTACLFARRPIEIAIILPVLFLVFGMQGWVTVLSGNIATIMYFIAAFSAWFYFTEKISTIAFTAIITALALVKPFYAEFLLFIWFARDFKTFILCAIGLLAAFFAINLTVYNELFFTFLETLKVDDFDNEIFGITLMSFIIESSGGKNIGLAFLAHLGVISGFLMQFIIRFKSFSTQEQFAAIFIIAAFINPKQITYDLMVCIPALTYLLIVSKRWVFVLGALSITLASTVDIGFGGKLWFQWWLTAFVCFLLVLFTRPLDKDNYLHFFESLLMPAR